MELPPEIILEIFTIILHSPLLETTPPYDSPYDVNFTLPESFVVVGEWMSIETRRNTLRRVCKLWNALATRFAGRFVYGMRYPYFEDFDATLGEVTAACRLLYCDVPEEGSWEDLVELVTTRHREGQPLRIKLLSFKDMWDSPTIPLTISDLAASLPSLEYLTLEWDEYFPLRPLPFDILSQNLPQLRTLNISAAFPASTPLVLPLLEVLVLRHQSEGRLPWNHDWDWNLDDWKLPSLRCMELSNPCYEQPRELLSLTHLSSCLQHLSTLYKFSTTGIDLSKDFPVLWELGCHWDLPFDITFIPPGHPLRRVVFTVPSFRGVPWTTAYDLHLNGISVHFSHAAFTKPLEHYDAAYETDAEGADFEEWDEQMEVPLPAGGGIYDMNGLSIDYKVVDKVCALAAMTIRYTASNELT